MTIKKASPGAAGIVTGRVAPNLIKAMVGEVKKGKKPAGGGDRIFGYFFKNSMKRRVCG